MTEQQNFPWDHLSRTSNCNQDNVNQDYDQRHNRQAVRRSLPTRAQTEEFFENDHPSSHPMLRNFEYGFGQEPHDPSDLDKDFSLYLEQHLLSDKNHQIKKSSIFVPDPKKNDSGNSSEIQIIPEFNQKLFQAGLDEGCFFGSLEVAVSPHKLSVASRFEFEEKHQEQVVLQTPQWQLEIYSSKDIFVDQSSDISVLAPEDGSCRERISVCDPHNRSFDQAISTPDLMVQDKTKFKKTAPRRRRDSGAPGRKDSRRTKTKCLKDQSRFAKIQSKLRSFINNEKLLFIGHENARKVKIFKRRHLRDVVGEEPLRGTPGRRPKTSPKEEVDWFLKKIHQKKELSAFLNFDEIRLIVLCVLFFKVLSKANRAKLLDAVIDQLQTVWALKSLGYLLEVQLSAAKKTEQYIKRAINFVNEKLESAIQDRLLKVSNKDSKRRKLKNKASIKYTKNFLRDLARDQKSTKAVLEEIRKVKKLDLVILVVDDILSNMQGDVNFFKELHGEAWLDVLKTWGGQPHRFHDLNDQAPTLPLLQLEFGQQMPSTVLDVFYTEVIERKATKCGKSDLSSKPPWTLDLLKTSFDYCEQHLVQYNDPSSDLKVPFLPTKMEMSIDEALEFARSEQIVTDQQFVVLKAKFEST